MTSQSKIAPMKWSDRRAYGVERARSHAFAAVIELWRLRKANGMKQTELADRLGRDTGWLSKKLRGPGNWTLKTLGEMVEALDGEIEIQVHDINVQVPRKKNSNAYSGYEVKPSALPPGGTKIERRTMTGAEV